MSLRSKAAICALLVYFVSILAPAACFPHFQVEENREPNEWIGTLPSNTVFLDGADDDCRDYFNISGGELRTVVSLDREAFVDNNQEEAIVACHVLITIEDGGVSVQPLEVEVLDVNDNVPRFSEVEQFHSENVSENFSPPNPIMALQPVDMDKGENGTVEFNITKGNEEGFFYIGLPLDYVGEDQSRLVLFFNETIDYETYQFFNLTITIWDLGTPEPLSFEQIIYINILDVNDEAAVFVISHFSFEVFDNHPVGPDNPFGTVSAMDPDSGDNTIVYSLYDSSPPIPPNAFEYISVNNLTGDIYLKQAIDFDQDFTLEYIEFSIQVEEVGQATIDIAKVNVTFVPSNVNVDPPHYTNSPNLITVLENAEEMIRLVFVAEDGDGINDTYILQAEPPISIIHLIRTFSATKLYDFKINETLDREQVDNITITLTIFDKGSPPLSSTAVAHIIVLDENDNDPTFTQDTYDVAVGENAPVGKTVTTIHADDPDLAENGTVSYTITSISPSSASEWFDINKHTGSITVNAVLDYTIAEKVSLVVKASDNGSNPRTANTTVNIVVSPAVTFMPRSYQSYYLDLKIQEVSTVYLEFRTSRRNGVLFYEENAAKEHFVIEVENGKLKYRLATSQHTSESTLEALDVSTDEWVSVLYDSEEKKLEAWYTELENMELRKEILAASQMNRCTQTPSANQTISVGGVDVFSHSDNSSGVTDFVGIIRNLIVNSQQVDLSCPAQEENTVQGAVYPAQPMCDTPGLVCSGPHYAGCFDYDIESHCVCAGGFNYQTCKEEENYAPIQLASSSMIHLELEDYSLYYDLELRSGLVNTGSDLRRKRSTASLVEHQVVEFQFRPLSSSIGVLLYSRTDSSVHTLEIEKRSSTYAWLYKVSNVELTSTPIHLIETINFEPGTLYSVSINITTYDITVSINGVSKTAEWTGSVTPFIQYPRTSVSLGGTDDPKVMSTSNFTGCISRFAVSGVDFPLNGLVERNDPSVKVSSDGPDDVSLTCDLCQMDPPPCSSGIQCINSVDGPRCICPEDQVLNSAQDACIQIPLEPLESDDSDEAIPLYTYIAGGVGVIALLIVLVVGIVILVRCKKYRQQSKRQTYHVGGEQQLPQLGNGPAQKSRPNSYTSMTPRHSRAESEPGYITPHRHACDSSLSTATYNEHDSDEDIESTNLKNMVRSKSSTSGETGFQTASERDERSIPRMEDSGNEKETEYSPFDSESDDSESCVETLTPSGINHLPHRANPRALELPPLARGLISSSPVSNLGAPLTPKEKKIITPLRPDSRSELDEETDLDTDFSSTILSKPCMTRAYRSSLKRKQPSPGRPDSENSGQQWYKSSTASDLERERKRAQNNRAYYPTRSEPFQLPPTKNISPSEHNGIPYVLPLQRKPSSPVNQPQPQPQSPRPKGVVMVDSPPISPLTKVFKYDHHTLPSPLSRPHSKSKPSKKGEDTELSTPVLSRSQPLKMHYPYNFCRQSSSESPRVPPHLAPRSYIPSYIRSYSEESSRKGGGKNFVDLGSVRTNCDPIEYWEGQRRMKATVDQVDSYHVLSESFTQFGDSTGDTMSMNESQRSGPEHQSFSSQGGGEATAEAIDLSLLQLRDCDGESAVSGTTLKGTDVGAESTILHFPSADCSDEYRQSPSIATLVGSSNGSDVMAVHPSHHTTPPSQETFEV